MVKRMTPTSPDPKAVTSSLRRERMPYEPPTLRRLGSVREPTLGGVASTSDGPGTLGKSGR